MSEFKREGRYIVVKPDYEDSLRTERLRNYIDEMCFHTPDCVVVEADWPEYEPVWRMIEQRVTGASADAKPVEVLGYSVVGNPYAIRLTKGEVLELSENYADHLIELVDRKHLTDAQVELAALREELAQRDSFESLYNAAIDERDGSREELVRVKQQSALRLIGLATCGMKREAAEQRLAAAEQRNATLTTLLREGLEEYKNGDDWIDRVIAALRDQPTESGASE